MTTGCLSFFHYERRWRYDEAVMIPSRDDTHPLFVKALQHEAIHCGSSGCPAMVEATDLSAVTDRLKRFVLACPACGWQRRVSGREERDPPWDDAALLEMAEEHLLHQQPFCPSDGTPVIFASLPNPRRRARYRLSCYYCGRQAEMDWPPPEAKR
ncbi:MAG: hypothetical protein ACREI3_07075 [Nitrospirales bacterium]